MQMPIDAVVDCRYRDKCSMEQSGGFHGKFLHAEVCLKSVWSLEIDMEVHNAHLVSKLTRE
jgi:hypothetical protein